MKLRQQSIWRPILILTVIGAAAYLFGWIGALIMLGVLAKQRP